MYDTVSLVGRTTSWLHREIEKTLRRCFEQVLTESVLEPADGRPKEVPDLSLWMAVIMVLLRGLGSQRAIWRLLVSGSLWHEPCYDVSDQAIYNRLDRQGSGPLPAFFARLTELLMQWLQPTLEAYAKQVGEIAPFARDVVALDESTLDAVSRRLPSLRTLPAGDDRLLAGKLVAVFDIRRQIWRAIRYVKQAKENEKQHAREMLAFIAKGALILTDRGSFSFEWYDELTQQGYSWIARLREQTTFIVMHTYFEDGEISDKLVWMGIWETQAAYLVRMVQFRQGGILYCFLSNVLDPRQLSMREIAQVYARRWDIERAFLALKQWLGMHLLWSSKSQVLLAQVWGCAILAQVMQAIRVQVAAQAQVEVFDVSMPLLMEYMNQWNEEGEEGWRRCVEQGYKLGIIRPSSRLQVQVPEVRLQAYQGVAKGRILVRPGRYPNTRKGWEEADEESQRWREAIRKRVQEASAVKRATKKKQVKEETEKIKEEVTKALKEKREKEKGAFERYMAKKRREVRDSKKRVKERVSEEERKWKRYWEQGTYSGVQCPIWQFYVPWYEEEEKEVRKA